LIKHHATKTLSDTGSTAVHVRWMASFTVLPLEPRGKKP